MKRGTRLTPALLMALAACSQLGGNGVKGTEQRTVTTFDEVDVSGGLGASITVSDSAPASPTLNLSGDSNLLQHVVTEVRGPTLSIRTDGTDLNPTMPLVVQTTLSLFTKASLSGGSSLVASGLRGDSFTLNESGGSTATIAGAAGTLTVTASGGSTLEASKVTAATVHLDASGGSNLTVCASERIDGSASGGSNVTYTCHPTSVLVNSSGGSNVTGS